MIFLKKKSHNNDNQYQTMGKEGMGILDTISKAGKIMEGELYSQQIYLFLLNTKINKS